MGAEAAVGDGVKMRKNIFVFFKSIDYYYSLNRFQEIDDG